MEDASTRPPARRGGLFKRGAEMRWYEAEFALDEEEYALVETRSTSAPLVLRKLSSWARLSAGADETDEASVPQDPGSTVARTLSLRCQQGAEGAGVGWVDEQSGASMPHCLQVSGSDGKIWFLAARTAPLAGEWFAAIDAIIEVQTIAMAGVGAGGNEDESAAGAAGGAHQAVITAPPDLPPVPPQLSFDQKQLAGFGPKKKSMARLLGRKSGKSSARPPTAGGGAGGAAAAEGGAAAAGQDGAAGAWVAQRPIMLGCLVERKISRFFAIDRNHAIPVLCDFADTGMTLAAVEATLRDKKEQGVGQRVLFGQSTVRESIAQADAIELSTGGEAVFLACDIDKRAQLVEQLRAAISDGICALQRVREQASAVPSTPMEKMGILSKRSQSGKSWKRRHFAIDWSAPAKPVLRSFKSDEELLGQGESKDVAIAAGSHVTVSVISKRRFCIQLRTPGRRLFLQATSAQHQREILERLDKVCYDCQLADDDASQELQHPFHLIAGKESRLWLPNSASANCMNARCCVALTWSNRQHCRVCGCLFCSTCVESRLCCPPNFNYGTRPQRVCDSCCLLVGAQQIAGPEDALHIRNAAAHVEDTGPDVSPELLAHYTKLGVEPGATIAGVRAAYREVAKKHHPDRESARKSSNPADTAEFEAIILAREAIEESLEADYGATTGGETAVEELAANCACEICQRPFGLGLRRHHCRRCGLAVCHTCSPSIGWKPLVCLGRYDDVRHCRRCSGKGELVPTVLAFAAANDAFLSRLSIRLDVVCVERSEVEMAQRDAEIVATEQMCTSDLGVFVAETGAPNECTALALYDETPTVPLALRRPPSQQSKTLALRPNMDSSAVPGGRSRSFFQPKQLTGSQTFRVSLSYSTEVPDASEEENLSLAEYSTHVFRRFSHFQWLRTKLLDAGHPEQRIPAFPGQFNRIWSKRDEHNERRADELATFLRGILLHPLLQEEPAFKLFVGLSDAEFDRACDTTTACAAVVEQMQRTWESVRTSCDWIRFKVEHAQGDLIVSELTRRLRTQEGRKSQKEHRAREQAAIKAEYDTRQMEDRVQLRRTAMEQRADAQEPRIAREEARRSAQFSDEKLVFTDRTEDELFRVEESRVRIEEKARAQCEQNALKAALVTWEEHNTQWKSAQATWAEEEPSWPSTTHFWLFSHSGIGLVNPAHQTRAVSQVLQNRAYVDAEHGAERDRITHERFDLENERRQLDELRRGLDAEAAEQRDENARWKSEDARLQAESAAIASELQRRQDKEAAIEKDIGKYEAEMTRQERNQERRHAEQLLRGQDQAKRKLNQEGAGARPARMQKRMDRITAREQESQDRCAKEKCRVSEQAETDLVLLFDRSAEDEGRSTTRAEIDTLVAERETNFAASQQEARCREIEDTARTEGAACREEENSTCLLGNPRTEHEPDLPLNDDEIAKKFSERR